MDGYTSEKDIFVKNEYKFNFMRFLILNLLLLVTLTVSAQTITDGLLLHYSLDNGQAIDASPNGIHGIVTGAESTADRFGLGASALDFEVGDIVEIPADSRLQIQWPFSFSYWTKYGGDNFNSTIFRSDFVENNYTGIAIGMGLSGQLYASTGKGRGTTGADNRNTLGTVDPLDVAVGEWVHVAIVYESPNEGHIYINGCEVPTNMATSNAPQDIVYTGATGRLAEHDSNTLPEYENRFLKGSIDEFYFWERSITEEEIATLFDRFKVPVVDIGSLESCDAVIVEVTDSLQNVVWSDGQMGNAVSFQDSGTYMMTATYSCYEVVDTFDVAVTTSNGVDLGADRSVCADSLILDVAGDYTSINWSTGETTPAIIVEQSGIYAVTTEDECGISTDEVAIELLSSPRIRLASTYQFCENEPLTISVGSDFDEVMWSTGSTGPSLTLTAAGNYQVSATAGDCPSQDYSFEVLVNPSYEENAAMELCPGESIDVHGQIIAAPGQYEINLSTVNGCDSIIYLEVSDYGCDNCDPSGRGFMRANISVLKSGSNAFDVEVKIMEHRYSYSGVSTTEAERVIQAFVKEYRVMNEGEQPTYLHKDIAAIKSDHRQVNAPKLYRFQDEVDEILRSLRTQDVNTRISISK